MSKRVALRQTDAELESQHRIARERLATASQRFERALAESERLKRRAQTLENDERSAAETNFRKSLEAFKVDDSDAAR